MAAPAHKTRKHLQRWQAQKQAELEAYERQQDELGEIQGKLDE